MGRHHIMNNLTHWSIFLPVAFFTAISPMHSTKVLGQMSTWWIDVTQKFFVSGQAYWRFSGLIIRGRSLLKIRIARALISITLTSQWPWWLLKSPTSWLFTQPFIRAQIKENSKAPHHWAFYGEFTGTSEFPAQMASNAENASIWWRHHAFPV